MKPTMKQMATELNKWYKERNHKMQYTIVGRRVIYVDYSNNREERGIAPIYVKIKPYKSLKKEYSLLIKGLLK